MPKRRLDHFSLAQFILAEGVQMPSPCDRCAKQKKPCVISDKSDKCSECVRSKKPCSLSSGSLAVDVARLLKAREKIEKEQAALSDEKQRLFEAFQAAEAKERRLRRHAQFLRDRGGKLIQEGTEAFEEELRALEGEQSGSAAPPGDSSSDPLVSEADADIIFSALPDDFWANLGVGENSSAPVEPSQGVR
jgi:hypothetical protein